MDAVGRRPAEKTSGLRSLGADGTSWTGWIIRVGRQNVPDRVKNTRGKTASKDRQFPVPQILRALAQDLQSAASQVPAYCVCSNQTHELVTHEIYPSRHARGISSRRLPASAVEPEIATFETEKVNPFADSRRPISNPVYFDLTIPQTQIRPLFVYHNLPDKITPSPATSPSAATSSSTLSRLRSPSPSASPSTPLRTATS